jgi:hypothetical protein
LAKQRSAGAEGSESSSNTNGIGAGTKDFKLPKFDGTNLLQWRPLALRALDTIGAEELVLGVYRKPIIDEGAFRVTNPEQDALPEWISWQIWMDLNREAEFIILSYVVKKYIDILQVLPNAAPMWQKIMQDHANTSTNNVTRVERSFHTYKMGNTMSMEQHINEFERLYSQCMLFGVNISEAAKKRRLLDSLNSNYQLINISLTQMEQDLSINDLTGRLLAHAQNHLVKRSFTPRARANAATTKKKKGKCYTCGEEGHYSGDC